MENHQYNQKITEQLGLKAFQVEGVLTLAGEGATIPFMARYRKEVTGGLDEVEIEKVIKAQKAIQDMETRRQSILNSIDEQGHLTDELKQKILGAQTTTELEDLYLPYKPKRQTRAEKARSAGLEGLAKILMAQKEDQVENRARGFLGEGVEDVEKALQGARDIIAEWVAENEWARRQTRYCFSRSAAIQSKVVSSKKEEAEKYKDYFDWSEPLKRCPSHRMLAMLRAENEGFLRLKITADDTELKEKLNNRFVRGQLESSKHVGLAVEDAYKRLLVPSIVSECMSEKKEQADTEAIKVFANNLKQLLLQPPIGNKRVLALDPGFRTGCKMVCLSETGELLYNENIYPHAPKNEWKQAMKKVSSLVERYRIEAIAIGNGTAGRETERLIKRIRFDRKVNVYVVDESGASIYSASSVGREEFPDYDVTVRGAVSIGRRLMDPLSELVKIDPKSIGVGQYQHDVDQKKLKEALDRVVESAVNSVGVDLNTASKYLLQYVSGIGPQLGENIVKHREEKGPFKSRAELKGVPRMGDKAFEQAAGFLRIAEAANVLDNSAVHPESYAIVREIAKDQKIPLEDLVAQDEALDAIGLDKYVSEEVGLPTLMDIIDELKKPGRDPRQWVGLLEFDESIKSIEDLKAGQELPGLVTNVTNFGAFVDIGIKQNGLVHISELADQFVSNPADIVEVYQKVRVRVKSVDLERERIQLSMKGLND